MVMASYGDRKWSSLVECVEQGGKWVQDLSMVSLKWIATVYRES